MIFYIQKQTLFHVGGAPAKERLAKIYIFGIYAGACLMGRGLFFSRAVGQVPCLHGYLANAARVLVERDSPIRGRCVWYHLPGKYYKIVTYDSYICNILRGCDENV